MRPNVRLADRGESRGTAEWELVRMALPEGEITGIAAFGLPFVAAAPTSGFRTERATS